jgi:hypothetical protein
MEHAVHISTGKFIKTVSPMSTANILKKVRTAVKKACNDEVELDLDKLDSVLASLDMDKNIDEDDSDTDDGLDAADTVSKALALVKQVSHDAEYAGVLADLMHSRYANHRRHTISSRSPVKRPKFPHYSFSPGFTPAGHPCSNFRTGYSSFRRSIAWFMKWSCGFR